MESIIKRLLAGEYFWERVLLGGLALLLPPLACGYLLKYSRRVRRKNILELPAWDDLPTLIRNGLPVWVILLATLHGPLLIAMSLSWMLGFLGLLPIWIVLFLGGPFFGAALYLYHHTRKIDCLLEFRVLYRMVEATKAQWLLPSLAMVALSMAGPLALFGHFLGLTVLTASSTMAYASLENKGRGEDY